MSFLRKKVPNSLAGLDSFDIAFMIMTGRAKVVSPTDVLKMVLKADEIVLWGPQAKALDIAFRKAYKTHCKPLLDAITLAFDIGEVITVDKAQIDANMVLWNQYARAMADEVIPKYKEILYKTHKACLAFYKKKRQEAKKAELEISEEWLLAYEEAGVAGIEALIMSYDTRILTEELAEIANNVLAKPDIRTIDRIEIVERIQNIAKRPQEYFSNMSDLEIGRAWNHTMVQSSHEQGIEAFQIIAERDNVTCPVCELLDGKVISVSAAKSRMDRYMEISDDPDSVASLYPFPRIEQIDNRPPEFFMESGEHPPFHPRCRCEAYMLY